MRIAALGLVILMGGCTIADLQMPTGAASALNPYGISGAGMPAEVADFIDNRQACAHFSSEDPYDDDRAAFLRQQTALYCIGSDAELARLRAAYHDRADVLERLDNLERAVGNSP